MKRLAEITTAELQARFREAQARSQEQVQEIEAIAQSLRELRTGGESPAAKAHGAAEATHQLPK